MVLDGIIVLLMLAAFYYGYKKGIINTLFMFICFFIGTGIVLKCNEYLLVYLSKETQINKAYLPIISIFILLVFFVLFFKFVNWGMEQLLKAFHLSMINQVAGGALFATLALFILSTVLWYIDKAKLIPDSSKEKSYTYSYVSAMSPVLMNATGTAIPYFKNMYQNMNQVIEEKIPSAVDTTNTR